MKYIEFAIRTADQQTAEIVAAELTEFPFEGFEQDGDTLKAFICEDQMAEFGSKIKKYLDGAGVIGYEVAEIEPVNWNELWESNFPPVEIDGRCAVRAPFHAPYPDLEFDIVITPKMSFGTGHHATTHLMVSQIMRQELAGLCGADIGSGTGVLSIAAALMGAEHVDAVDIDDWAYENCGENISVNGVAERITPILGDIGALSGRSYDFVLANINRNILLADMGRYAEALRPGGLLLMSGILVADVAGITEKAASVGLTTTGIREKDGWALVECRKS